MYTPSHFQESRRSTLRSLMRAYPLATLITQTSEGISADHIPILHVESGGSDGVLQGHVARANPIWERVSDGSDVLAIFQGPNRYISPKWYPSKEKHGRVVPTWNYLVVHARGRIQWKQDPSWLRKLLVATTEAHEGTDDPWQVERMRSAIVGFEVPISELAGKWKLSQNRSKEDRLGVIAGLSGQSTASAAEMLRWMEDDSDW